MTNTNPLEPARNPFHRDLFIELLDAGLAVRSFRFVRDAALAWLSHFPGDLKVSWFYGKSLSGEGRLKQALPIFKGLSIADPEFKEAVEALQEIIAVDDSQILPGSTAELNAQLFALTGEGKYSETASSWGRELWLARVALGKGRLNLAEASIRRLLLAEPGTPLVAVTHLQFLAANPAVKLESKLAQVRRYKAQWPDCLACTIYLAEWMMASGDMTQSVALIHQAAARDVAGQVARRIWGLDHPYTHLWPEKLELGLEISIPAEVSAFLGWNRLPELSSSTQDSLSGPPLEKAKVGQVILADSRVPMQPAIKVQGLQRLDSAANEPMETTRVISEEELGDWVEKAGLLAVGRAISESEHKPELEASPVISSMPVVQEELEAEPAIEDESETLIDVQNEIGQLGDRLKVSKAAGTDGRFPIYVLLSLRSRLAAVYGENVAGLIQDEMQRLASLISRKRGWGARVFIPDDPLNINELGIKPPRPGDAWELKLSLVDLDAALEKKGEMIGALLIVGGPEIVPFHRLPNPLEDPDIDVPSDNPYATRDENYFIPEWPVGRLPGGSDGDPGLLLAALRRVNLHHTELSADQPWYQPVIDWLSRLIRPGRYSRRRSFGYTAAIWQQAAASVFSKIGEPGDMHISPPCGLVGDSMEDYLDDLDFNATSTGNIPAPLGTLGYFNLHGVADAVEWFGHRDPLKLSDAPEFPIALRPQDLRSTTSSRQGGFPSLVFSEACYGAHIEGKTVDSSLALRFLETGTLALVGSTCMSYGSIMGSLSAADLLAQAFWRFSLDGFPAGEALRQAKIEMIRKMDQEQGYLDGQDQKTLLSFNLYGDPLAQVLKHGKHRKSVVRSSFEMEHFDIVCDRLPDSASTAVVPENVLAQVRLIVSQYLPGMSEAHMAFVQEKPACDGLNHKCPTSQLVQRGAHAQGQKGSGNVPSPAETPHSPPTSRDLVTLSKQVKDPQGIHPYYAHLTLEHGKLVKLVVSR